MVSARLRFEVLRRDGHRCKYCGTTSDTAELTVDHVIPAALGGADTADNLVTACQPCNAGKAATGPDEQIVEEVDERAIRWADAMKRAAEIQNARRLERELFVDEFDRAWRDWTVGENPPMRPPTWKSTVGNWHDAGLETETLIALIDDVMPRRVPNGRIWRYYCGAVSHVLRDRQTLAQKLLEGES